MTFKVGDIIDENKNYPQSCRISLQVLAGGEGFQKILCCGNELDDKDVVKKFNKKVERYKRDTIHEGVVIDEKKNHPNSCGFKVKVLGGGAGFKKILCCGNELDEKDIVKS